MKKLLVLATLLISLSSFAQISGNVSAVSDYVWRGVTQTGHNSAVQGGFDFTHDSGLSLGTWTSNITNDTEADFYGKFSHAFSDQVSVSLGYIYYYYFQTKGIATSEFNLGLSLYGFDFMASYSGKLFGVDSAAYYFNLGHKFSISEKNKLSLGLNLGYFKFEKEELLGKSFIDYKISLIKSMEQFEMSLNYTNTDRKGINDQALSAMALINF